MFVLQSKWFKDNPDGWPKVLELRHLGSKPGTSGHPTADSTTRQRNTTQQWKQPPRREPHDSRHHNTVGDRPQGRGTQTQQEPTTPRSTTWQQTAQQNGRGTQRHSTMATQTDSWHGVECWQKLTSYLPHEKYCYGWLHRRLLRRYRPQSAVNCSTLWEQTAGSQPSTSQVSLQNKAITHTMICALTKALLK